MLMGESIGIWGVVVQNAAYAVIIPVWCIVYLSTSPRLGSNFLVDVPNLAGIAISMILGYVLPTILMSLPAPSIIDYDLKQWLMTFWQFFPVWVSVVQGVVAYLLPRLGQALPFPHMLRSMRVLYAGLLTAAGIGQIATATLMATSKFFPGLFAPGFVGVFNPSNVFLPAAISSSTKMPSIGAGALLLFQYDYFIGSASMALWSTTLFLNKYRNGKTKQSLALMIVGGVMTMALTGPLGYVTASIWARDELIIAEAEVDIKKAR